MTSTVILSDNGASSGSAGLKSQGGNDGTLLLQTTTSGGTATTAVTIDNSQNVTFANGANLPNTFGFKNRIINGAMVIDQRNAGASVTPTNAQYLVDRWYYGATQASKFTAQQNAGSVTPPVGFTNYLGLTSSSAYSVGSGDVFYLPQVIEGLNISDFAWGTASAATVTLSFWVRSSLTGTFGGSLQNSAANRSYPFSYTISSANTWEQKTITVAGDTSGTWLTTNGKGIQLNFSLGSGSTYSGTAGSWAGSNYISATGATSVVGTNGATFYITGVQLEKSSQATSFDFRSYGTELALCQRYYYRITAQAAGDYFVPNAYAIASTAAFGYVTFPVPMRTRPTALEQSGTATDYNVVRCGAGTNTNCSAVPSFGVANLTNAQTTFTVASGLSNGVAGSVQANNTNAYLGWSAEL
jgi:hypothetical protein